MVKEWWYSWCWNSAERYIVIHRHREREREREIWGKGEMLEASCLLMKQTAHRDTEIQGPEACLGSNGNMYLRMLVCVGELVG